MERSRVEAIAKHGGPKLKRGNVDISFIVVIFWLLIRYRTTASN